MPATGALYAGAVAATSGTPAWTTTTNAVGSTTATFAGWAPTTGGATGYIQLGTYGAQAATNGGVQPTSVDSVVATVRFHVTSATARWTSITAQLYDGASTAIGAAQTLTLSTTATNEQAVTFTGVTWAQLANLNVRVTGVKSGTQASTLNVDRVGVVVNYTLPGPSIATLTDAFATADAAKWAFGAAATVTGGQLVLTPNTGYTGDTRSVGVYSAADHELVVEMVQAATKVSGTGAPQTFVGLYRNPANVNDDGLFFQAESGFLTAHRMVATVYTQVAAVAYDPVAHRWLRIREALGTVYWDTSPNRSTWTNQGSWVHTFSVDSVYVLLGTGLTGAVTGPGNAVFDNVNTVPEPTLVVRAARAAARASRPLLTQASPLTGKAARSATRASRPALTQQQPTPAVHGARAATRSGAVTLTQAHPLTAAAARAATRASAAVLTQTAELAADGARAATRASVAALTQATGITANAARAATSATDPVLDQHTPLAVNDTRAETRAYSVTLTAAGDIALTDARSQTRTTRALLTQDTVLTARDARADTRTEAAALDAAPATDLTTRNARADTRATVPALEQLQLLAVAGARAPTGASRARMPGATAPAAPPERTLTVAADNRATLVARDNRTTTVAPDDRAHRVAADNRTTTVPAATRTHAAI